VAIKPLLELKVGDKGHCLTVFQGITVEKFEFRVMGILFNYFPRQHLILIRSDDPKVKLSGIVAGMSGSPCYVDGKLAGALAYGPNWTKQPIAMLTPIQYMLDELKRPLRGPALSPVASLRRDQRTRAPLAWTDPRNPLGPLYRSSPGGPLTGLQPATPGMRRLSVPLAVSGFDARTLADFRKAVAPYGFDVVQGGGASSADALRYYPAPKGFVDGGSIGVQLMRGAVSMNGTGTVTLVQGSKVLAFGHPMSNLGEHYLPVTSSWIHMFMPSYSSSYKISTALGELGTLVSDRRPCIIAETGRRAPMIPVTVTLEPKGAPKEDYSFEVFSNRQATPFYMNFAFRAILQKVLPDAFDTMIHARFSFDTEGAGTITMDDYFHARSGAGHEFYVASTRGFKVMAFLAQNPLAKVQLKRLRVHIRSEIGVKVADLEDIRLTSATVNPGQTLNLLVRFKRRYQDALFTKLVPVTIPRHVTPGTVIKIEVSSGPQEEVDAAPLERIADVLGLISRWHHARQLVVRVLLPGEGTSIGGRIVTDLPGSVLDSLRSATSAKSQLLHRASERRVIEMDEVIAGRGSVSARVVRAGR
jgi:hypothetical protein